MSKVFLKKGDVQICWGNLVDFPREWSEEYVKDKIKEAWEVLQRIKEGIIERILGRTEGILMGLDCEEKKINKIVKDIKDELYDLLEYENKQALLDKFGELLKQGWIYEKED